MAAVPMVVPAEPPRPRTPSTCPAACSSRASCATPRAAASIASPRSPACCSVARLVPAAAKTRSRDTSGGKPGGPSTPASRTSTGTFAATSRSRTNATSVPLVSSVPIKRTAMGLSLFGTGKAACLYDYYREVPGTAKVENAVSSRPTACNNAATGFRPARDSHALHLPIRSSVCSGDGPPSLDGGALRGARRPRRDHVDHPVRAVGLAVYLGRSLGRESVEGGGAGLQARGEGPGRGEGAGRDHSPHDKPRAAHDRLPPLSWYRRPPRIRHALRDREGLAAGRHLCGCVRPAGDANCGGISLCQGLRAGGSHQGRGLEKSWRDQAGPPLHAPLLPCSRGNVRLARRCRPRSSQRPPPKAQAQALGR